MDFKIQIVQTEQEFANLEKEWQTLVNEVQPESIFLTFEWIYTWWQVYGKQLPKAQPFVITLRAAQTNRLQAILPLFTQQKTFAPGVHLRAAQLMGTEVESSDYLDLLSDSKEKIRFLTAIFEAAQVRSALQAIDVLLLENVHDHSTLFTERVALQKKLGCPLYHYQTKICPYITLPKDLTELMSRLSKNFRSSLKRLRNKFKRAGFRFTVVTQPEKLESAIPTLFHLHALRFKAKQAHTKFNFEKRGKFHLKIAQTFLQRGWLQLYQILDGEKVIGSLYCFKFNQTMMYMQGGFDPQYTSYGLGNQIILRAIEDAIALKLHKFDFMRGGEAYKFKWTQEVQFLHRVLFPLSLKARLFFRFDDGLFKFKKVIKRIIKKD